MTLYETKEDIRLAISSLRQKTIELKHEIPDSELLEIIKYIFTITNNYLNDSEIIDQFHETNILKLISDISSKIDIMINNY